MKNENNENINDLPNLANQNNNQANKENNKSENTKANEMINKAKNGVGDFTEKIKNDSKSLIICICACVLIVIVGGFLLSSLGATGKVKAYANAYKKANSEKIVKLYHKDFIEAKEASKKDIEDILDDAFDQMEDEDIKIKGFKILDKEKYDKERTKDYARDVLEDYYDIDRYDVKKVIEYDIKYYVDDDGDNDSDIDVIHAVKISGKWYIFD